jgi:serine/threonine protein kinase
VYLGTLPSGQRVTVKRMYRSKKVSEFYDEASVLATLRHRNLATLVGYCLGDRRRHHALVYEYMAGGSLCRALSRGDLPWRRRLQVAADVTEGLAYLHALRVVHRDVKPANVLLSSDLAMAKLSDFGVACAMPAAGEGRTHLSTEVRGTRGYVDPKTFADGHVTEAADVYGFGVVLLELAATTRAPRPTPWWTAGSGPRGTGPPCVPSSRSPAAASARTRTSARRSTRCSLCSGPPSPTTIPVPMTMLMRVLKARPLTPLRHSIRLLCRPRSTPVNGVANNVGVVSKSPGASKSEQRRGRGNNEMNKAAMQLPTTTHI